MRHKLDKEHLAELRDGFKSLAQRILDGLDEDAGFFDQLTSYNHAVMILKNYFILEEFDKRCVNSVALIEALDSELYLKAVPNKDEACHPLYDAVEPCRHNENKLK